MCWHQQEAVTCLGSSLPSHTACVLGTEAKARRAGSRTALILLEVHTPAHVPQGQGCAVPPAPENPFICL